LADWHTLESILRQWRTDPSCHDSAEFRQALFAALFASPDEAKTLQCFVGESPFFQSTRLRIHIDATSAPALLAELPWHLARWEEQSLASNGWTFELSATPPQAGAPRYALQLKAPFHVLLIAPGAPDSDEHVHDLIDLLRDTWPTTINYVHVAHTAADIASICRDHRPKLVYFCGPATVH